MNVTLRTCSGLSNKQQIVAGYDVRGVLMEDIGLLLASKVTGGGMKVFGDEG